MSGPGTAAALRSVWRHRAWRWLLVGDLVSLVGDFLYWVALVVHFTAGDDGPTWVAAALLARFVPYVVVGPVGGALADRLDRRWLLLGLNLARAGVFCAMAAVVAADGPRTAVVALVAMSAVAGSVANPARVAATPVVVPEDDLAAANAAGEGLSQLAWFVGPAVGALLVTLVDPAAVLLVDAATFVVSAVIVLRLPDLGGGASSEPPVGSGTDDDAVEHRTSVIGEVRAGLRAIAGDRGLTSLTALAVAVLFAFGAEQVLYVLVAADRLGLGAEGIGYLMAAMGVGGVIGASLSVRAGNSARLGRWLVSATAVACAPLVLISFLTEAWLAYLVTAVEGAAAVIFEVGTLTLLQRVVSEHLLGRVYSVQDSVGSLAQVAGSVAAPVLVATIGLGSALRVCGVVAVVVAVVAGPGVVALARRSDDERRALASTVDALDATVELGAFARADLERLARASTKVAATVGDVVVREGDAADALYLVRSGRLSVSVDGSHEAPPDLVAGDVFGEIGLLHGGHRTATVTAVDDTRLVRIDGGVFADVATPASTGIAPLLGAMTTRLARTHHHLVGAASTGRTRSDATR